MASAGWKPETKLRAVLRELAVEDVAEVLDTARARARARAQAMLEDALVDELLSATGAKRPVEAAVGARPTPAPPEDHAWWAYCVLRAEHVGVASALSGIEPGSAVEAVVEAGLAALVSRVPLADYDDRRLREHLEDIDWLDRTARAHEGVLERAMREAPIVPLRLCTLYRDTAGVHRMLEENQRALAESLSTVEDATEWGVKVFVEPQRVETEAPAEEMARAGSGADYLANRRRQRQEAERIDQLCTECAEEVHRVIGTIARQARTNPVQPPEAHGRPAEMILNSAYLIDRTRVEEAKKRVAELAGRWQPRGFSVELTGPWPPYNFVSDSAGMLS